ncbi:uroporphyrinogen-III synthase [Salicibibacter cibarius]|uniref:Uroporphyrinogen-III synthase n=1 Tax=Salicibibacter cibarius TaxID=2743000 RepID=A0A7T6Z0Y3_9BACI|nr:uroporphyrinogen-III synthase [Salicibibacter cibarius]QQK74768.1 uroporphyrinogen-III synthase [Salicibibacter cibarius]
MRNLEGKHVAITASRKTDEMQTLLHKQGATSDVRPMQGTVNQEKEKEKVIQAIEKAAPKRVDWFIFTTGIGVATLMEGADEAGVTNEFLTKIKSARVAARGYKTVAALKKMDVDVDIRSDDGTTAGLMEQLKEVNFSGKHVIVQQYGLPSPVLDHFLEKQGATVTTWLPYIHEAPEHEAVDHFIRELVSENKYDAVCFTTGLQVKSLFHRAKDNGDHEQLLDLLENKTIATAVGKVTAEALVEEGVNRVVTPSMERMGAMVVELSRYVNEGEGRA